MEAIPSHGSTVGFLNGSQRQGCGARRNRMKEDHEENGTIDLDSGIKTYGFCFRGRFL